MPRIVFRDLCEAALAGDSGECARVCNILNYRDLAHLEHATALQFFEEYRHEAIACLLESGCDPAAWVRSAVEARDHIALARMLDGTNLDMEQHVYDCFRQVLYDGESAVAAFIYSILPNPQRLLFEFFDVAAILSPLPAGSTDRLFDAVRRSYGYIDCLSEDGAIGEATAHCFKNTAWERCILHIVGPKERALSTFAAQGRADLVRVCVSNLGVPINTVVDGRTAMDHAKQAFAAGLVEFDFMHFMHDLGAKTAEALAAETRAATSDVAFPSTNALALAARKQTMLEQAGCNYASVL